ncbi:auxin response factor 14 isoform X2 [Brachypodium distachyon]|uniref:Auxin response factor n=2 Tax=Brachypodium distachyon TaxID=15368 RepID=A0A0Q3G4H5_BRADI|nr:auxin response factor 14 isoform X2 [Brachypodium distachyon]KQK05397.1 hypothetical protein BRADI_2g19867v3 [Brachypodium distachyon]|eukprot:XP_003568111.1 auxin response factor 14 isoform X2 [Brachypodium distachyon]
MGIDLNTVEEDGDAAAASAAAGVCGELWHACAGPGVSLPRQGSALVYLPQGHLASGGGGGGEVAGAAPPVPPHVACRVLDVELCADAATDEVYARLALVAVCEMSRQNLGGTAWGEEDMEFGSGEKKPRMPHMFCKTLTASDTSTHGGFSVPRRAAEDCFPPLDYEQVRPSQELIAKDLHGTQWRFRHIYRGQPRRHLLTTGWSSFVNKKKLVSGDAVLFLRGCDGELRLGIRRAVQLRNEDLFKAVNSSDSRQRTLSAVASSFRNRSTFHVCFDPRSGASEFIVPYWKFSKSLNHPLSIGMRFKLSYESEDANERSTGMISGVSEVDPIRWPGSKWRCLLVRWDGNTDCNHQHRISPWEIERVGGMNSVTHSLSASNSKRTKLSFPESNLDAPVIDGNGYPDSMEIKKFRRVLQGQELMGSKTRGVACSQSPDVANIRTSDNRWFSNVQEQASEFTYQHLGFGESVGFPEVLQGQEMSQAVPFFKGTTFDTRATNGRVGSFSHVRQSAAPTGLPAEAQGYSLPQFALSSAAKVSSPSSVLMFNQATVPQLELEGRTHHHGAYLSQCSPLEMASKTDAWLRVQRPVPRETGGHRFDIGRASTPANSGLATRDSGRSNCRLFGFSLTEKILGAGEDVKGGNSNEEADRADPRLLELFGHSHPSPSALHALVAAPLGM